MKHSNGITIALSAAALFLAACSDSKTPSPSKTDGSKATPDPAKAEMVEPEPGKVACFGANACSGQSQCNVPDGRAAPGSKGNACAGQNDCRGKGWISLTEEECAAKGGRVL